MQSRVTYQQVTNDSRATDDVVEYRLPKVKNPSQRPSYMKLGSNSQTSKASSELADISDEDLLLGYRDSHERNLFDELVHRYEREIYNYLRRYLGNIESAEDVFQATFLQLHLKCTQYEEGRKVRPWLYTIATNQAIDAQRRNKRHRALSLDRMSSKQTNEDLGRLLDLLTSRDENPLETAGTSEDASWVQKALVELPEQMQSALTLVYYQGLKYRQAADVLSVPVGTVKSRVHGAILRLAESWKTTHQRPS